jgi:UDP-N-acetyl-D-mannosaminuronic acid dehydrogenase
MKLPTSLADSRVCIIGLGYVGLTLAVAMADSGFRVFGVEIRDDVLEGLRKKKPHFHEPRLEDKLARVIDRGTLEVGKTVDPAFDASVYIITVGTPLTADGVIQLRFIEQATQQVADVLKDGDLVILRSTVKLGTARNVVSPILAATGKGFGIAMCPERTLEGRALLELHELPQIIGADDADTRFRCAQLFSIMTPTTVNVSSLEAAELVKLTDNTYRDVTFAFANEISKLCARIGVSAREVIGAGKLGYPRTNVAWPGPVGGPCLEKDPHILAQGAAEYGVEMAITRSARRTNEEQPADAASLIAAQAAKMPGFAQAPRIALMGLAFKGVPATDDLRGTMARPILAALKQQFPGATVLGYDSVVEDDAARAFFGFEVASTIEEAFRGADLVVIANNHPDFRAMDLAAHAETMARPGIVYDFWNLFDDVAVSMPDGVVYLGLGSETA